MARNSLLCADVPLRNYSLTHSLSKQTGRQFLTVKLISCHDVEVNARSITVRQWWRLPHNRTQSLCCVKKAEGRASHRTTVNNLNLISALLYIVAPCRLVAAVTLTNDDDIFVSGRQ